MRLIATKLDNSPSPLPREVIGESISFSFSFYETGASISDAHHKTLLETAPDGAWVKPGIDYFSSYAIYTDPRVEE